MMLAPLSARRVETRRAEWARRNWPALHRRSSDSVAAPSQQHQLRRSSFRSVADATRRMSATELLRSGTRTKKQTAVARGPKRIVFTNFLTFRA